MGQIPFFPTAASSIAWQVDLTLLILLGLSAFFTTIVMALIIHFSIKYRRGKIADRSNPPTTSLKVELGWMGGLLVLALGTYTAGTVVYYNMTRQPEEALEIYGLGLQWMWKFQHPNGQSEINELHVPKGEKVRVILTSEDVIHSFYVPAFRLKYDAVPGRYTNMWFEATQTGTYHIFCAEFCGTDHARMIGKVYVMEPREYQAWLTGGQAQGGTANIAQSGEQIFANQGCTGCHVAGSDERAPDLVGLFGSEETLQDGTTVTVDENYLRESILLPNEKIVQGYQPIMPTYEGRLSEEEMIQLISYLKTLGNNQ